MICYRIINSIFGSCTYIVHDDKDAIIVDCGDIEPILSYITKKQLSLKAVCITHSHYDHIYGLNRLIEVFPSVKILLSSDSLKGLSDSSLNLSAFHGDDFIVKEGNFEVLADSDEATIILSRPIAVRYISTPGHTAGSVTYIIGEYIFTGDSYIPGTNVFTKLNGDRVQAKDSENNILQLINKHDYIICCGHYIDK